MASLPRKPGVASFDELRSLTGPIVLDLRDPNEVEKGKGGPPAKIPGSVNVPLNHDGVPQAERETTVEEFLAKIADAGVELPTDKNQAIVTHCGSGGRGNRGAILLRELGFTNVHNGGGPSIIAEALGLKE
eukprot:CAMPEP_0172599888 /NCGR_PEP_ID=MMETSP1068-20121228/20019_1 /TAXON_ID=35684 /ORGANISM="Pseudopedinella elastica, Strain CCMP716" /LENGTH=130 /DNA_ID=CAMNT_0013400303 /DNA_START=52 /DNA_END=444 /DNA_ORIENTATION=+